MHKEQEQITLIQTLLKRKMDQHSLHFLAENPTIYTLMELINTKKKKFCPKAKPTRKTKTKKGNCTYVENFTKLMIILKVPKTSTPYS
jgi:hypothetical protein